MNFKTNDPALKRYIEIEREIRRQNAAAGINQSIEAETPEAPKSAEEAASNNELLFNLLQEFKSINNNLHLIQRELKNINKTLGRRM